MERFENAIFTNMCLIRKDDEILIQIRTKTDWPGVTFPGGHVEKNESFDDSIKREVFEETGLKLNSVKLKAIEEYKPIKGEDRHVILLYESSDFSGQISKNSNEDEIMWIKENELFNYQLSDDLDVMYKAIVDENVSELVYYYDENGEYKKKLV